MVEEAPVLEKVSPAVITVSVPERAAPPTEAVAGSLEAGTNINYEYSNQFRTNVFSPKSEVLTRMATMNMFTIKDSTTSFTYNSHVYFWGTSYVRSEGMQTCRYVFDNDREEKEKLQREHDKAVRNRDRLANEMAYNLTASKFLANITNAAEKRQKWKEFIEKREELHKRMKEFKVPPAPVYEKGNANTAVSKVDFGKAQFENGTRVREISFGCKNDEMCCGLLCCERKEETVCEGDCSINWGKILGLITCGLTILFGICNCIRICCENDSKQYAVVQATPTNTVSEQIKGLSSPPADVCIPASAHSTPRPTYARQNSSPQFLQIVQS
ncbi:hypothetical protein WR25_16242 [Diploscapter pachys]|uniref:CX domain-containing protein n=1 Tax=Diploscapter pachys TaxID=2018661 RepID=A0A2A2KNC2_9BILA|nr:hypothetical protein WR25_16242 [Diploscapter pachys]